MKNKSTEPLWKKIKIKGNIGSKFGFISFIANARDLIVCAKLDHINKKKNLKMLAFSQTIGLPVSSQKDNNRRRYNTYKAKEIFHNKQQNAHPEFKIYNRIRKRKTS